MKNYQINVDEARRLAAELSDATPAFTVERRDSRTFVEVALDFQLTDHDKVYRGVKLSRRLLTVQLPPTRQPTDDTVKSGDASHMVKLSIPLSGFELALDLVAMPMLDSETKDGFLRYKIADGDSRAQMVLAQLVRSVLTGILPGVDDLVLGHDEETPQALKGAAPAPGQKRLVSLIVLAASFLALGLGLFTVGTNFWEAATKISSESAIIATPRSNVISLDFARVGNVRVAVGAEVRKGQLLVQLESPQIENDIRASEARLSALLGPARQSEKDLLAAHRQRQQSLLYYSPCDCIVEWVIDADNTVSPGTKLIALVKTGSEDLRVLAQIPASAAQNVRIGQVASVEIAGLPSPIAARVEHIGGDAGALSQFGQEFAAAGKAGSFPVVLKPASPLNANIAGLPVKVVMQK